MKSLRFAALCAVAVLASSQEGRTANPPSPAEIAAHRQEILDAMLTEEFQPALIANLRQSCALGSEPARVAESRAGGAYFTPDAADGCVAALVRTARDRRLPELYRQLLAELGGSVESYEKLPRAIGAAVLGGGSKVAIGNSKTAAVTSALAFDAGFTVAYLDGSAGKAGTADAGQIKALAETCLSQHQDAGTCFSVGYLYGAQAFRARTAAAR